MLRIKNSSVKSGGGDSLYLSCLLVGERCFLKSDDEPSDENHQLTLNQGRANYQKCGISYPELIIWWADNEIKSYSELMLMMSEKSNFFEIHCWEDENEAIELALQYGKLKRTSWHNGKVIFGRVTTEFKNMLASLPATCGDKKTPFFSVFFDNGFSSEHYGTEINYFDTSGLFEEDMAES